MTASFQSQTRRNQSKRKGASANRYFIHGGGDHRRRWAVPTRHGLPHQKASAEMGSPPDRVARAFQTGVAVVSSAKPQGQGRPQAGSRVAFEIDHVIARHHHGRTVSGNLALSCAYCNGHKGPNLSGRDPASGKLTRLYHPRRHKWPHHFRYEGGTLIGRTAIGRTTVDVLRINQPQLVALREILMAAGVF